MQKYGKRGCVFNLLLLVFWAILLFPVLGISATIIPLSECAQLLSLNHKSLVTRLDPKFGIKLAEAPFGKGAQAQAWLAEGRDRQGKTVPLIVKESTGVREELLLRENKFLEKLYPGRSWYTEVDGTLYLAMEFFPDREGSRVPAPTLQDVLDSHKKDYPQFSEKTGQRDLDFIDAVARGLLDEVEKLNKNGHSVVHGDLSLGNVLLGKDKKGRPLIRLIDFGSSTDDEISDSPLPFSYGTSGFLSRQVFQNYATPERDVRAVQKILLSLYLRDSSEQVLRKNGVLREAGGYVGTPHYEWVDPLYAFDDGNVVGRAFGFALESHVPTTISALKQLLQIARKEKDFVKSYVRKWKEAFNIGSEEEKEDLVLEVIRARSLGPQIFTQLGKEYQKSFLEKLNEGKEWIENYKFSVKHRMRPPLQPLFGWHFKIEPLIKDFLKKTAKK